MSNPSYFPNKRPPAVTVAVTGSTKADAALLEAGVMNNISGADGTKGAILPVGEVGTVVRVFSPTATNAVPVYPPSGGKINNGTADAAKSVTAQKPCEFECIDATSGAQLWTGLLGS